MDEREADARALIAAIVQCIDDGVAIQKTSPIYVMALVWLKNETTGPEQKKEDRP